MYNHMPMQSQGTQPAMGISNMVGQHGMKGMMGLSG